MPDYKDFLERIFEILKPFTKQGVILNEDSELVTELGLTSLQVMELIEQIRTIYDNYDFETEILVASIRHPLHVAEAALIGADIATIPFAVIEKLAHHPLTDIGIERFQADWEKARKSSSS